VHPRTSTIALLVACCCAVAPSVAAAQDTSGGSMGGGQAYGTTGGQAFGEPNPALVGTVPGTQAKLLPNGLAAAPAGAPAAVQKAVWAANEIIGLPYRYGGGHRSFQDTAFDCSGTVSHALGGASLLRAPLDSSDFMSWGAAGRGTWITVYTNPGHAYTVIAGLRLDTSAADDPHGLPGPRWRPLRHSNAGYRQRHPVGY